MTLFTSFLAQASASPEAGAVAQRLADAKTARMIPILSLGIVFALGGLALFALAMREKNKLAATTPKRKSDERGLVVDRKNNAKLRTVGGILAGFGAVLVVVSQL